MSRIQVTRNNHEVGVWVRRFARFGYAVKGITYFMIALLALKAALGSGHAENTRGAMQWFDGAWVGTALLAVVAAGLGAYALYKMYFAIINPEHAKVTKRLSAFFVAGINAGFAWEAAHMVMTVRSADRGGNQAVHWTAMAMNQPMGVLAIGITGVCVAGYGLGRIRKAIKAKLDDQLSLHELKGWTRRLVVGASRLGIAARGFVFVLVGIFLIQAARHSNPGEAKDIGHSLRGLQDQPLGSVMLAIVAIGLFLYGVYQFVRAMYRRFDH